MRSQRPNGKEPGSSTSCAAGSPTSIYGGPRTSRPTPVSSARPGAPHLDEHVSQAPPLRSRNDILDPFSVSTRVLCQDHYASSQKKAPSSTSPAAPSRAVTCCGPTRCSPISCSASSAKPSGSTQLRSWLSLSHQTTTIS